jgi:magnesium transporter
MIRALRWDPALGTGRTVGLADLPPTAAELKADDVVWIDLENPTPGEEEQVFGRFFPVHPLTLEDITKPRRDPAQGAHLPKVEEFPNYLFVIVNPLPPALAARIEQAPGNNGDPPPTAPRPRLGKLNRPQLSGVLTHQLLITHHYDKLSSVDDVRAFCDRHGDTLHRGPDYLFHLVLDEMVDDYAPVVERVADRLDRLETRIFHRPTPDVLAQLLRLKRQVSILRKTLILEREVLARLIRGQFALVATEEMAYYRNVYDHLVRYTELTESAREMVSDLMQTHLSAVSNRLNEIMKVLTMISTVILPMTLISGIYGMNFHQGMPELDWKYGYPYALGLMVLSGIASFTFFKWKRWI